MGLTGRWRGLGGRTSDGLEDERCEGGNLACVVFRCDVKRKLALYSTFYVPRSEHLKAT